MFFCKSYEIFKNTFLIKGLGATASKSSIYCILYSFNPLFQ